MIIKDFELYRGQHCESTATGCLLKHSGLELSEPMLFGLGQGLGFIYWKMSIMNLPFIGGRSKQFDLTIALCRNLNIMLDARETSAQKKAWSNISNYIHQGIPVGLQVDMFHLEYFEHPFHFAGHFVCMYGYDSTHAYLSDTGTLRKTSLESLEKARFEKGPMASKARSWTIELQKDQPALKDIIPKAIGEIASSFLNPPIKNLGYKGIHKLSKEIVNWIDMSPAPQEDLVLSALVMEEGGTGGSLFRNLFRDFLKESQEYLPGNERLRTACELYTLAAANWAEIARLIREAGKSGDRAYLERASVICAETAKTEHKAMEELAHI